MWRGLHIRWYHYRHHFYLRNLCHTTKKSNLYHSVLYRNNHQFWMHRESVIQLDLISRLFQEDRIVLRFSNLLFLPVFLLKMVKNIIHRWYMLNTVFRTSRKFSTKPIPFKSENSICIFCTTHHLWLKWLRKWIGRPVSGKFSSSKSFWKVLQP